MKKRGYDAERELVQKLRKSGFEALRVPVSAPSSEPFPDVFAVKDDTILAFEVKSQKRYAYYKRSQISKLYDFLDIHKIYPKRFPVLAGKFKYKGWVFKIVEKLGDYSLRVGQGISFKELTKKLEENNEQASATDMVFTDIESGPQQNNGSQSMDFLLDIPLEITVELGKTKIKIGDLLKLGQGSVVELNKLTNQPLEIFVNKKLMAQGEVVVVNEKFGIRLTNIISPGERVKELT